MSSQGYTNANLELWVKCSGDGLTIPEHVYYSAPFKLTNFFRLPSGGIEYILMNASAGIMAGDDYQIDLRLAKGSQLLISAQSFEKIHAMSIGTAKRKVSIQIAENADLIYSPLPTIPFQDSAFVSTSEIRLLNESSRLIYSDIISSGRALRNESFAFTQYHNLLSVYLGDKIVYRDNCYLIPNEQQLHEVGMFESYSHLGSLIIYGYLFDDVRLAAIQEIINQSALDCGISALTGGGHLVRALSHGAEPVTELFSSIKKIIVSDPNK